MKISKKTIAVSIVALFLCASALPLLSSQEDLNGASNDIDAYIKDVNGKYDLNTVIASTGDVGIVLPAASMTSVGGDSVTVTYQRKTVSNGGVDSLYNISSNTNDVYPGAILRADGGLANGSPTQIALGRSDVSLNLNLPNSGGATTVNPYNYSDVRQAIDNKLKEWADNGGVAPISYNMLYTKTESVNQASVALGISTDVLGKIGLSSKWSSKTESTTYVIAFTQVFYTVSASLKSNAHDYFASDISLDSVKDALDGKPSVYVKSVTYGRTVAVSLTSTDEKTDFNVIVKAIEELGKAGSQTTVGARAEALKTLNSLSFSATVVGGNAIGVKLNSMEDVMALLNKDITIKDYQAAAFLNAKMVFLGNNQPAKSLNSTEYVEKVTTVNTPLKITFKQTGVYMGNCEIYFQTFTGVTNDGFTGVKWDSFDRCQSKSSTPYSATITPNHLSEFKISIWASGGKQPLDNVQIPTPHESIYVETWGWSLKVKYSIEVDGKEVMRS